MRTDKSHGGYGLPLPRDRGQLPCTPAHPTLFRLAATHSLFSVGPKTDAMAFDKRDGASQGRQQSVLQTSQRYEDGNADKTEDRRRAVWNLGSRLHVKQATPARQQALSAQEQLDGDNGSSVSGQALALHLGSAQWFAGLLDWAGNEDRSSQQGVSCRPRSGRPAEDEAKAINEPLVRAKQALGTLHYQQYAPILMYVSAVVPMTRRRPVASRNQVE
ncbi:hypothetical protein CPLU01_15384 [Colletotrichum plurivorum]|uniref:Uncharacterized protein n=1 Tax=Colletotrichum plurivorum TaxID=2175906 RepID=A0A8H6JBV2_9PEZI|nr:hypothetical protein CPLU01_15384 [Colletotrichum plurivorum]